MISLRTLLIMLIKRNKLNMLLKSSAELSENQGEEGSVQKMGKKELGPKIITHKLVCLNSLSQLHISKVKSRRKT